MRNRDMTFDDRVDAGRKLALALSGYRGKDLVVLAIPRGGVVVGYEVARELGAPLDVVIPHKIRAPGNPELAIGAVTQDGTTILDRELTRYLQVPDSYLRREIESQIREINRRVARYRGDRPMPALDGRVVVIVDDGVATGATVRAAIRSVRKQTPSSIVVAVPVGPSDTIERLRGEADDMVCLSTPEPFLAIGQFYRRFDQTSDEEVVRLLELSKKENVSP
jgi:putative phosphoribosyl transferase